MALRGRIRIPSDKSISHRAVLFSSMAEGVSRLRDVLPSDDVLSTVAAVRALGARVAERQGRNGLDLEVEGFAMRPRTCAGDGSPIHLDCGNSGTTTRLLLGMLAGLGVDAVLDGDESLRSRPMARVLEPLSGMGARLESNGSLLPVRVHASSAVRAGTYTTRQASAQVKSAIVLAGLSAAGTTRVTEPAKSRDHTERLLPAFGVPVDVDGLSVSVSGPARPCAHDMTVPGDPSSAVFVAVAAALVEGSDVVVENVSLNPTRTGAFEVMRRMGCDIAYENEREEGSEPVGDVHVRYTPSVEATRVAAGEIPALIDEIPVLSLLAAAAAGETVFESAGELRVKESDRFEAIVEMLGLLGYSAFGQGDDLHIIGREREERGGVVDLPTRHDHRLAMSGYVAGLCLDRDVRLDDPGCVRISWPTFFEDMGTVLDG